MPINGPESACDRVISIYLTSVAAGTVPKRAIPELAAQVSGAYDG
jgi:hypothetical protein